MPGRPERGGDPLVIRRLADDEILVVYRVVHAADVDAPAFADSFKSRAELGLPPRRGTPEARDPRIAEGISVFLTEDGAASTARAVRERGGDIGGHVARLVLRAVDAVEVAAWGSRDHVTLWADPIKLARLVTDILPVDNFQLREDSERGSAP